MPPLFFAFLDANSLGGYGSFGLGVAALLSLFGGYKGLQWAGRILRPRHLLERDRSEAIRERDNAVSEAGSARSEAVSARNEAASWRSAHDELERRVNDIEKRLVPKLTAALKFIQALVEYIRQLEEAMENAKVHFETTLRVPEVPPELKDDLKN